MNLWSQLLVATGGALEPAKSFCYLLDYEFHPALCAYRYRSKDDLPGEFLLLVVVPQHPVGLARAPNSSTKNAKKNVANEMLKRRNYQNYFNQLV